jgi:hypothetical protein
MKGEEHTCSTFYLPVDKRARSFAIAYVFQQRILEAIVIAPFSCANRDPGENRSAYTEAFHPRSRPYLRNKTGMCWHSRKPRPCSRRQNCCCLSSCPLELEHVEPSNLIPTSPSGCFQRRVNFLKRMLITCFSTRSYGPSTPAPYNAPHCPTHET